MKKPLELHVYEKHAEADAYRVGGFYSPYALVGADKRFADAELAAEAYKAEAEFRATAGYGYGAGIIMECDRKQSIILRFATLPHYDEA